jgi:predicted nucleic acid-binding protein
MACYYDSSFFLSYVIEEKPKEDLKLYWEEDSVRLSSILLPIECIIAVRRAAKVLNIKPSDNWVINRIKIISEYIDYINLKVIDSSIKKIIQSEIKLSDCRSLDAVHLATALYYKPYLSEPLAICSLDKRMRYVAKKLDFKIIPQ